jgi:hypothetical protein
MFSSNLEKASFLLCGQFPLQAQDHRNTEKAVFLGYAFLLVNDVWLSGSVRKREGLQCQGIQNPFELLLRLCN